MSGAMLAYRFVTTAPRRGPAEPSALLRQSGLQSLRKGRFAPTRGGARRVDRAGWVGKYHTGVWSGHSHRAARLVRRLTSIHS